MLNLSFPTSQRAPAAIVPRRVQARDRSRRSLCLPFATVNGTQVEGNAAGQKVRRKGERKHKGEAVRVDDESVTEEVAIEPSFFPDGQNICWGEHHLSAAFVC